MKTFEERFNGFKKYFPEKSEDTWWKSAMLVYVSDLEGKQVELEEKIDELQTEEYDECTCCGKRKSDVASRPDAYANDVGNDPSAMHTVCDSCDHENRMDI